MQLGRRSLFLITLASCLLFSCAQVGSISGGEKDIFAPKITKSSILHKQRNVSLKVFSFEFDERIVLNNGNDKVVLVPSDATAKMSIKGKTLVLEWDKEWSPNTTYSLYLNASVKDFREGNDSLYTFVFSSGPDLDSASCVVRVKDALTNMPVQKITVGLFETYEQQTPRYFARTDKFGIAEIKAVKEGQYVVKAFEDANTNLILDSLEKMAFDTTVYFFSNGSKDSINLALSTPRERDKIKNNVFIAPGLYAVHAPSIWHQKEKFLNGKAIGNTEIFSAKDSLVFSVAPIVEDQFTLVIGTDTLRQIVSKREKLMPIKLSYLEILNGDMDSLVFEANDFIQSIDQSKILVKSLPDSTIIPIRIEAIKQRLVLKGLSKRSGNFVLLSAEGALIGASGNVNKRQQIPFVLRSARELGVLNLTMSKGGNYLVRLLKDGKRVKESTCNGTKVSFSNVLPGKYDIHVIIDDNNNGEWDPVDPRNKKQPEQILIFPDATSIRANWEVEKTIELY